MTVWDNSKTFLNVNKRYVTKPNMFFYILNLFVSCAVFANNYSCVINSYIKSLKVIIEDSTAATKVTQRL